MSDSVHQFLTTDGMAKVMDIKLAPCEGVPDFWGKPGWARFARKVVLTETTQSAVTDIGPLLAAEWLEPDGTSCRIATNPFEVVQRQLIRFPKTDASFEQEKVSVHGHSVLKGRTLLYDIYWADDGDGAVRRALDIFRGFGDAKGNTP